MRPLAATALGAVCTIGGLPSFVDGSAPQPQNAVGNWRIRTPTPVAVRGGVVAVEIEPADARSPMADPARWPESLQAKCDDGTVVDAVLGVITPAPARPVPSWTTPSDDLVVLTPSAFAAAIASGTISGEAIVVALIRFDAAHAGPFDLAGSRVAPKWFDADASVTIGESAEGKGDDAGAGSGTPSSAGADDRPDRESPGEYWRWVLLAQELEHPCESPWWTGPAALYAQHRAELWCAGLARLRGVSASVATELRERLTARVRDPQRPDAHVQVAAWVAQPSELTALLAILLDTQRTPETSMRAALGWLESRSPLTIWIESDAGGAVTLAAANPMPEEIVLRCAWLEAPKEAQVALLVPAHQVARMRVERPFEATAPPSGRSRSEHAERWRSGLTLRLEAGAWRGRVIVGPGVFSVRPPGLGFSTFVPSLTLVSAQSQRMDRMPSQWSTTASVRRLAGRWEIFIECLAPIVVADDLVEVTIGDPLEIPVRFTVNDGGTITMIEGVRPTDLVAHARRHAYRWRVRIELPESWIPKSTLGDPERAIQIAMERRPGPAQGRQTAVLSVPSWRPPPPIRADLSSWIEMPAPRSP